jgi:Fe-S cluster biogenesis protein NfuA
MLIFEGFDIEAAAADADADGFSGMFERLSGGCSACSSSWR